MKQISSYLEKAASKGIQHVLLVELIQNVITEVCGVKVSSNDLTIRGCDVVVKSNPVLKNTLLTKQRKIISLLGAKAPQKIQTIR